jgi:hypothetical protein
MRGERQGLPMRGVIREYRLDPAHLDEVIRRISEAVPSVLQTIPGFVSWAINDAGDGRMLTYSVFEDASGTQESTKRAAEWVRENIASLLPIAYRVTEGDLRVRHVVGQPKFGVVRGYHVEPRNVDTFVTRVRDGFLPIISAMPGFTSWAFLDAGNGTVLTLSGFTSRESADEALTKVGGWVRENLASLIPDPPEVIGGEIKAFVSSSSYLSSTKAERDRRRAA